MNPGYGIYPAEDRHISSIGSLSSPSRKATSGWWCPYCYNNGMFSWLQPMRAKLGKKCDDCGGASTRDMRVVKVLMVGR